MNPLAGHAEMKRGSCTTDLLPWFTRYAGVTKAKIGVKASTPGVWTGIADRE